MRARSGLGLGASSGDPAGSAAPQLRSETPPQGPPGVDVKTGFPQRAQRSQPLRQARSPHRAPRSPWGSGRGGAPGHPSYPAGSVCKKHSLHCLQETLSCLQTTFSSIKGCLEVSRGLSAWRRLSQRKFPCPLAGLAPEAEGTARGDRGEAAHPRPRAGAGIPGEGRRSPRPVQALAALGSSISPPRLTWKHLEGGEGSELFPARA